MPLTTLPFTESLITPSTHTTSYVFHSPRPLQRFSIDLLRSPRGLSGTVFTPPTPKSSPCTYAIGGVTPFTLLRLGHSSSSICTSTPFGSRPSGSGTALLHWNTPELPPASICI